MGATLGIWDHVTLDDIQLLYNQDRVCVGIHVGHCKHTFLAKCCDLTMKGLLLHILLMMSFC